MVNLNSVCKANCIAELGCQLGGRHVPTGDVFVTHQQHSGSRRRAGSCMVSVLAKPCSVVHMPPIRLTLIMPFSCHMQYGAVHAMRETGANIAESLDSVAAKASEAVEVAKEKLGLGPK